MNKAIRTVAASASPIVSWALERAHARRGGVILVYHEVSARQLRQHLGLLSERYRYVSLSELVSRLAAKQSTAGLAAITYDDGYAPVVEDAAQLSAETGWPMTFYLPTRYLDTRQPFWYQELRPLLDRSAVRSGSLGGIAFKLGSPASNDAAFGALNRFFRSLRSEAQVETQLRELRRTLHGDEERPAWLETTEPISWERVRTLSRDAALSFEAHTVNHLALSRLDDEGIRAEMERCCNRIEEVTGRSVEHFCYPFGGLEEIGEAAQRQARRRFRSATTMRRGRCNGDSDLAMLPRVPLYEGDSRQMIALKVAAAR
jgi:peptidoglycan/xylan/chitin deacetylase (PgdA/CDA1 family)